MTEKDKKTIEFLDEFFALFDDEDLEEDNNETNNNEQ